MRILRGLFTVLALAESVHAVSQNFTFIAQQTALIPACGLTCLTQTVPAVGCSLLNTTCQCVSENLVGLTTDCLMQNCALSETLQTSKITATICERPSESRQKELMGITMFTHILTCVAVILRLYARIWIVKRVGPDDWVIVLALITDIVFWAFALKTENTGLGSHVWDVDLNSISNLFFDFYIVEIFYVITNGLVKISILLLYLQLFPGKRFRLQCWMVFAFIVAHTVTFAFATIFQCSPVQYTFDKDIVGRCINYNAVAWAHAGLNILQDLLLIALPLPELRGLRLTLKRKMGLVTLFGLWGFVCATSIVRLYSLKDFGLTSDPTWSNVDGTIWSSLEIGFAMVCCSLPAYRAAAAQLFPSLFDGTSGYSSRRKEKDYRKPGQSFRSMFSTNVTSAFDSKKHPTTRVEQQSIELSRASIDEGHGSDDQLCSPTKATGPESTRDPTRELERPALDQIELRPIPKRSDSMNLPEPIHPNSHPFAHSVIPKKSIASSLRAMASRRFSFDSAYDLERQHLTAQDPQQDQGPPYADANDKRRKRITLELDLERQGSENSELKDNLRDRVRERREKTASRGSISGLASPDGGWWGGLKSGGSWNPNGRENRGREVGSI